MPYRKVFCARVRARVRSDKKIRVGILFAPPRGRKTVYRIAVIFLRVHANGPLGPKEMKKR